MNSSFAHEHNRKAWDAMAKKHLRFTQAATKVDYQLATQKLAQQDWLEGDINGQKILLLASGGGAQSGLLASLGAKVTVVDISAEMLRRDLELAKELRFDIRVIHTSMDDLCACESASFDVVIHPVSTCYVPDIRPVYAEVARVCRSGAIYISHHKQPASLQAAALPEKKGYLLQRPLDLKDPLPEVKGALFREEGTLEYVHSLEVIMGELCRNGFSIEDVREPWHGDPHAKPGDFGHRSRFLPPFLSIKARRKEMRKTQLIF